MISENGWTDGLLKKQTKPFPKICLNVFPKYPSFHLSSEPAFFHKTLLSHWRAKAGYNPGSSLVHCRATWRQTTTHVYIHIEGNNCRYQLTYEAWFWTVEYLEKIHICTMKTTPQWKVPAGIWTRGLSLAKKQTTYHHTTVQPSPNASLLVSIQSDRINNFLNFANLS